MTFILAEKPSVAESFALALGVSKSKGCYQNEDYTITNCIGHLLTLYDAQDYDEKLKKWDIADLPIVPEAFRHKPNEKTAKQLGLVNDLLAKKYDKYIIATDAGREGELIARLVLHYSGLSDFSGVFRFWTSSALTKEVILDCLGKCKPAAAYDDLYASGLYRQLSDWLVGINFSRFFSVKLNNKFIFGRVQTPVLAMITARETEIKAFKKSFFYRLEAPSLFAGVEFVSYLTGDDPAGGINFDDRAFLEGLIEKMKLSGGVPGTSLVEDVLIEKKTQYPPRLFDLTELQKAANNKFGYTSKKTLDLAQALYEKHKCLSYPRTASRYLSRVNYDLFIKCLHTVEIGHAGLDINNKNIFNDEAMEKNKEDHHALILLNKLPDGAGEDERNIYGLIFANMAAIVKNPYVYEQITVKHGKHDFPLVARGVRVIDPGWKEKDGETDEEEGEKENVQALPDLKKGDEITLKDLLVTEHEKKPPKSFTESMLLTAMKKYDLGTVATRDTIIEGLVKNEYVFRKGKNLLPADKAFFFIDAIGKLNHAGLSKYLDVTNTKDWENMLEDRPEEFFSNIKAFVASTIDSLKSQNMELFQNSAGSCPVCGSPVLPGKFSFYCSNRKDNGVHFSVGRNICEAVITGADIKALLAGKKTGLKNMKSKNGKEFKARLKLDKNGKVEFEFEGNK
jgi:DNA topoisomerase-3